MLEAAVLPRGCVGPRSDARARAPAGRSHLPGSGTGELQGVNGTGEMVASRAGNFTMTLDYDFR